jgi:hypothetical protein
MTKLLIEKDGIIKGGEIEINYIPIAQQIRLDGFINVGIGFITKKIKIHETKTVPADLIKSDTFHKDREASFEGVSLKVIEYDPEGLTATVFFNDHQGDNGIVLLGLTNEYPMVLGFSVKGQYAGKELIIKATVIGF